MEGQLFSVATRILLLFHGFSSLSSWGLITSLLGPSWRAFILGVHEQLPPASKIAGGNVGFACVGLCTLPIATASSSACLLRL